MTAELGGQPCGQGFDQNVLLVAEAAAHVGLDDADTRPGNAQRLTAHAAHDVGDLGGADHRDFLSFHVRERVHGFHVTVLHSGHAVMPGHDDRAGCRGSLIKGAVSQMELGMHDHIARLFLVQTGRAGCHRLIGCGQCRQGFNICLDQPRRTLGADTVTGNHNRNLIAPHADMRVEQLAVTDVLMGRNGRPRVSGGRELNVGHVETGENAHNAGDGLRLGEIKAAHPAACDRCTHDLRDVGVRGDQIGGVFCLSGDFCERIYAWDTLTNCHKRFPPLYRRAARAAGGYFSKSL